MTELGGYAGKILSINLTKREAKTVDLDKSLAFQFLGGRGFNSKLLYEAVGPDTDPLGPENMLMFATGPLVGTMFPTASRFNISAKSPQTGILGDTNAGGHLASEIKFAGYDQIVLEGRSSSPVYVYVNDGEVEFKDATHMRGKDVYETDDIIKDDLGDRRVQTAIAGPAAENGVRFAGVFANLMRAASRTGMGTVMASKGVKALAVRGTGSIEVAHPRRFERLVDEIVVEIRNHEQYE
nr:aldehyde:ferredoxin oxidoreductase [Candidatus Bathyarchaeota archaeon]